MSEGKPRKMHVMSALIVDNPLSNRELARQVKNDTIEAYDKWILGELRKIQLTDFNSQEDSYCIHDSIDQLIETIENGGE